MPALGGAFDGCILTHDKIRVTGQLCQKGHTLHLDFEQRGIAEVIFACHFTDRDRRTVAVQG